MAKTPADQVLLRRALEMVQRGHSVTAAAQAVGLSRACLYTYGIRSGGVRR